MTTVNKAYAVSNPSDGYTQVVFAATPGKAKYLALVLFDMDAAYPDLRARRMQQLDKYFAIGKDHFDWWSEQDRIVLVRDASFVCSQPQDCSVCAAKQFCDVYLENVGESWHEL